MLFPGTRAALRAYDGLRDESPLPWFFQAAGVEVPQKRLAAAHHENVARKHIGYRICFVVPLTFRVHTLEREPEARRQPQPQNVVLSSPRK